MSVCVLNLTCFRCDSVGLLGRLGWWIVLCCDVGGSGGCRFLGGFGVGFVMLILVCLYFGVYDGV